MAPHFEEKKRKHDSKHEGEEEGDKESWQVVQQRKKSKKLKKAKMSKGKIYFQSNLPCFKVVDSATVYSEVLLQNHTDCGECIVFTISH